MVSFSRRRVTNHRRLCPSRRPCGCWTSLSSEARFLSPSRVAMGKDAAVGRTPCRGDVALRRMFTGEIHQEAAQEIRRAVAGAVLPDAKSLGQRVLETSLLLAIRESAPRISDSGPYRGHQVFRSVSPRPDVLIVDLVDGVAERWPMPASSSGASAGFAGDGSGVTSRIPSRTTTSASTWTSGVHRIPVPARSTAGASSASVADPSRWAVRCFAGSACRPSRSHSTCGPATATPSSTSKSTKGRRSVRS
jgi:hypothetical protein